MKLGPKSTWNESFWLKQHRNPGGSKTDPLKNESGSYYLILQSKLESAKALKRWVIKDVLPSIRKTGTIEIGSQIQTERNGPP